jgi:hypothetical protein
MGRYSSAAKHFLETGVILLGFCLGLPCLAGALLQCDVSYAGTTHKLKATPTADPYTVQAYDIGGRFFFKMVLTETNAKLDHVLIYACLTKNPDPSSCNRQSTWAHFQPMRRLYLLTGEQHVYGGPIERELIYSCWLSTATP